MALATAALKTALENALQANIPQAEGTGTAKAMATAMADSMATAIEAFVKSGKVKFATGKVTGTSPPGTSGGPITAGAANGGEIE
jgi:hypothetical protein